MESPPFQRESEELNHQLQGFSREELASLMGISQKLANLSYSYIQDSFSGTAPVKPALFTYSGTVFKALNPGSLDDEQLQFAREHVRILSGMYGILKPSSGISPYRLELKTVGMYAKTARILMERIVDLRILKQGKTGGYRYNENLSNENDWVFTRNST